MRKNQLTIVIPSYNEEDNLPSVIQEFYSFNKDHNFEIIFINDGSKDKTLEILSKHTDDDNFKIISHKVNRGYGGAIKSGIRAATTKYVITLDADGQHYFSDVEKLYTLILNTDADMIVGRRIVGGSSRFKSFGKWIIRLIAKTLLPLKISDLNSGMKIYRTDLAKKYIRLCPDSMAFSDVIALVFISFRHLIIEEDIQIKERKAGKSTINIRTAFQTLMEIVNIVILFNPLKIFLPTSAFLFLLGIAWGIKFIVLGRGLSIGSSFLLISSVFIFLLGLIAEQLSHIRRKVD